MMVAGIEPATVCYLVSIFLLLIHQFIIKHSLIEYLAILDDDAAIASTPASTQTAAGLLIDIHSPIHSFIVLMFKYLVDALFNPLKMLVVLAVSPVTAPLEAGFGEELEAEVVVGYLVGEVP